MSSAWFEELHKEAVRKGVEEETRMLYVAMTRAVNKLVMLVNDWDTYVSWSTLIRKVGLINE
jgi:superfamily I DNA/RNA helicase